MKTRSMMGLCLGVSMALTVASAQADPGKGKANSQSLQVRIDKKTGRKTGPDDSAQASPQAASTVAEGSATTLMPLEGRALPTTGAGKGKSAQVGLRQMKFLTVTIDENGDRHVDHKTLEEIETGTTASAADRGKE